MEKFLEFISQPWSWYAGGIGIGLMVPVLLLAGNKHFGMSSSLRHICAACIPIKTAYFNYDWKEHSWNLMLATGVVIGGFIATKFLSSPQSIAISANTKAALAGLGINDFSGYVPAELFSLKNLLTLKGLALMVAGGFLVGFGTRYANGCTSGHSIMGLSLLNLGSLVATLGFFAGGLLMTYLFLPVIFKLL
ncbi:MAG TPA: YeeE/YedE thiosulfate transporter family protein [Chitinophagales bacterium]|nr:YeeE/YedE thiosulfate transporter family protein [Chitinophagales bacterium]